MLYLLTIEIIPPENISNEPSEPEVLTLLGKLGISTTNSITDPSCVVVLLSEFVCALALIGNDTKEVIRGTVEGYIKEELIEGDFFGYDPLFFYPEFNKTFAEASAEEKNAVSHRGNALAELKKILTQL